jgi:hypothetical protein
VPAQIILSIGIAPPPLPVYEQPFCPTGGYIWTPGYWAYADEGYFWAPGTWALAPEPGLLWTPGYWGWGGGAFIFSTRVIGVPKSPTHQPCQLASALVVRPDDLPLCTYPYIPVRVFGSINSKWAAFGRLVRRISFGRSFAGFDLVCGGVKSTPSATWSTNFFYLIIEKANRTAPVLQQAEPVLLPNPRAN